MSVALDETGVAPESEGDAWNVASPVVGPVSAYPPQLAAVRELRPATATADTDQFPVVGRDSVDASEVDEDNDPEPRQSEPEGKVEAKPEPQSEPEEPKRAAQKAEPQLKPEPVTENPKPRPEPEPESEPAVASRPEPKPATPQPVVSAPVGPGWVAKVGGWISGRWNAAIGSMASAAFVMGLFGSGLGQLSYWSTKFPFWLAMCFAMTFELAMVGIARRVRQRKIAELPAGAMHFIGWCAAMGAAGWNFIHLSDPNVVVRFALINDGAPLFHGGPVVGASFGTIALLGFLIHEQSEKYHVEDALARKGKKIQRIGAARAINYPRVSWTVWRNRVADPTLDIDAEFLRVLSAKRGEKVLAAPPPPAGKSTGSTTAPTSTSTPATTNTTVTVRGRSEVELDELVDATLAADRAAGQRLGFRKLVSKFDLTQADARKLRSKANTAAEKQAV